MKGGCFIVIFLLICIESFSSLDYENFQHDFSQGCPVHAGFSWNRAKDKTNCSGDQFNQYHCVINSTGQPFKVMHICAQRILCFKGTMPIYDEREKVISCKPCREGYYQQLSKWSDEASECSMKHKCEGNKIECDTGTGLSNTQDVYCRCDARKGYILTNFENGEKCVEWAHATCYFKTCPDGQERLLNYSCAPLCPLGQRRDDNDICIPIILVNQTTSSSNDSLTVSGETTPKTTVTTTQTSTTRESNIPIIIVTVGVIVVVLIIGAFIFAVIFRRYLYKRCRRVMNHIRNRIQSPEVAVIYRRNLYKRCRRVMNCIRNRRQSQEGPHADVPAGNSSSEGARPNEDTNVDVSAGNNSSEGARRNEGPHADVPAGNSSSEGARPNEDPHADVPTGNSSSQGARPNEDTDVDGAAENNSSQGASTNKANMVQIGDKNLSTYNFPAERQKTLDDSSSTHSSVSSLADSPHLPSSSLGELPVSRNLSSLLNLTEDIEQDTQPNQISNGRDSSEIHADTEQTYRKVV